MRRILGFIVSLALLAAAVWAIGSQREPLERALETARAGRLWLVGAALVLPLLNWLLTGGVFYFLMLPGPLDRALPRVSYREMTLLIGSAWLLNYLPMSPGMFGRVAYHKTVHRIPVATSVRAVLAAMAVGVPAVLIILMIAMIWPRGLSSFSFVLVLGIAPISLGVAALILRKLHSGIWRYSAACAVRYLDVLVWVARYAVVFELVGRRLSLSEAVAIAAVSQAAMQVPMVGNGLGVREWAIGLVGPALPAWMRAQGAATLTQGAGLSADLINRGLELVVALPMGLACMALLARNGRSAQSPSVRSQIDPDPQLAAQADPLDRRSRKGY